MPRKIAPLLTAWPAIDEPQSIGEAARIAETARFTLEQICKALMDDPKAKLNSAPQSINVAKLYAQPNIGLRGLVQAGKIYRAMDFDLNDMPEVPLTKAKTAKPSQAAKQAPPAATPKTYKELLDEFWKTLAHKGANGKKIGGPLPRDRLNALYDEIAKLGSAPAGIFDGRNVKIILGREFLSLGDFMAHARAEDRWPFILPRKKTRPTDLFSAKPTDWRSGDLGLLTMEEWHIRQAEGLEVEATLRSIRRNKRVARILDEGTGKGKPGEKRTLR